MRCARPGATGCGARPGYWIARASRRCVTRRLPSPRTWPRRVPRSWRRSLSCGCSSNSRSWTFPWPRCSICPISNGPYPDRSGLDDRGRGRNVRPYGGGRGSGPNMGSPIRLLLADDHTLFRQVLRRSLAGHARFEVVGEAADTDEAIREAHSLRPDMVLMDLEMPGDGGVAATRTLRAQMPGVEVVIVTGSEEQDDLRAALAAGAKGYVLKSSDYGALIASLEALAEGEAATLPDLTPAVAVRGPVRAGGSSGDRFGELSERELQVIRLLAEGASNRTIASQLFLSENTVRTYVAHILEKLGLENRVQAAAYALRHGLVS